MSRCSSRGCILGSRLPDTTGHLLGPPLCWAKRDRGSLVGVPGPPRGGQENVPALLAKVTICWGARSTLEKARTPRPLSLGHPGQGLAERLLPSLKAPHLCQPDTVLSPQPPAGLVVPGSQSPEGPSQGFGESRPPWGRAA